MDWESKLVNSLHMRYFHEGKWKLESEMREEGVGTVVAHPMFDPDIEEAMDRAIGKQEGNKVYARAFKKCNSRANKLLDSFSSKQHVLNSRAFRNAIVRLSAFAPEAAHELARAYPPPKSG
jgi:hypothetical protein